MMEMGKTRLCGLILGGETLVWPSRYLTSLLANQVFLITVVSIVLLTMTNGSCQLLVRGTIIFLLRYNSGWIISSTLTSPPTSRMIFFGISCRFESLNPGIFGTIRLRKTIVEWHAWVWHKLKINRYAHLEWQVCLDRFPTLSILASFGMQLSANCSFCINRIEDRDHLFLNCHFSRFVLEGLA